MALPMGLAAFVLTLRLVVLLIAADPSNPEVFEYEDLARNLLAGKGFTTTHLGTTYRSLHSGILYVLLNAAVCGLTNHRHLILLLAQSILSSLLVVVVFRIGSLMFNRRVATLAAFLVGTHPGLLLYDTRKLHPLSLDALLIAAAVLAIMSLGPNATLTGRFMTGVIIGLGMLQRGTLVVFAVVAPLWAGRVLRPSLCAAVGYAVPIALGTILAFGPWVVRNVVIHRTGVVMTTSGEHFWRGNHPGATGTSYARDGRDILASGDERLRAEIASLDELGQMRAFARSGLAFWRQ